MNAAPVTARTTEGPAASQATEGAARHLSWLGLGALVALQIALILNHEPWRDELQAVLLAQRSATLAELFTNLHYEGHPALWYLLLRPLAPLGPLATLKIVEIAVALATIAIVWMRAPFGAWTRLLILASYPILFEWGTIARSYSLGATLFFAFLALRRHWTGYLMLALMANISVHFTVLSGVCILLMVVRERRISAPWIAIWVIGCLAAVAAAYPADGVETAQKLPALATLKALSSLETISYALIPIDPRFMPPHWTGLAAPMSAVIGVFVAVIGWSALSRDRRAAAIFLLFFAAMFAIGAFLHPNATRHTAMLFLLVVGLEWVLAEDGMGPPSILTVVWTAILAVTAFWVAGWSFVAPFTPIRAIVAWTKEHGFEDAQWAAYPVSFGVDLSANLKRPLYDPQKQCVAWFQKWDSRVGAKLGPKALNDRLASAAGFDQLLLLSDGLYDPATVPDLSLVATFPADFLMENWFVYAVNAPAAPSEPAPPPCD